MALSIRNLEETSRAFARADTALKKEWRQGQKQIAEPTRATGEAFAVSRIRNVPSSPAWARLRTGVTLKFVYVAPRQKGVRGRGPKRRPNFADLMMDRAMEPSLEQHQEQILHDFERLLDSVGRGWEH